MNRRGKVILVVLLGGVAGLFLLAWGRREPRYQGRTLTSWLEECANISRTETQQLAEAEAAVRAIGAEKALPYLLRYVSAQDGPIRSWLIVQRDARHGFPFRLKRDLEFKQLGKAGFEALKSDAAPAVPQLTLLLNDTNHAFAAVQCLLHIGKPAKASVCQALTNSDWRVRLFSVERLASVVDDEEYMARMKECLNDTNSAIRLAAVENVGARIWDPDLAIPLLISALQDTDPKQQVASAAAKCLGNFGTNSLRAFGALSNTVVKGWSITADAALRAMVRTAPSETLPMVLEDFGSEDFGRRYRAIQMLCGYPMEGPEVQSVIEKAMADADVQIASMAKGFIARQQANLRRSRLMISG